MTRQQKALQLLRSKEKVCCYDFANIWVYGYADVIMKLRRKGYQITTTNICKRKDWGLKRYWEYRLLWSKTIENIELQQEQSLKPNIRQRFINLIIK